MTAVDPTLSEQAMTATHCDELKTALRQRGWVSDRYLLPESSDEFEWPPSIPASPDHTTVVSGTVIYLEPGTYWAFAPQRDGAWMPPRAVYSTPDELLADLYAIESWRCPAGHQKPIT